MDKKDIYEHLAKIYLDASSKRKKKSKFHFPLLKNIFFAGGVLVFGLGIFLFSVRMHRDNPSGTEIALVLNHDTVKINFNFDPAKKEVYSLNLNKLNMSAYKSLGFSVKNAHPKETISLRVEFTNAYRERSEIYFRNIPYKWQDFRVSLSDFKGINDWSEMSGVSFSVEEWNAKEKRGVVYIDNVRLLR